MDTEEIKNNEFPENTTFSEEEIPQTPSEPIEEENEEENPPQEEDDEEEPEEPADVPGRIIRVRRVYPNINEFYLTTDNLIFLSYQQEEAWQHQNILGEGNISIY